MPHKPRPVIKYTWLDWYPDRRIEEAVVSLSTSLMKKKRRRRTLRVLDFGCGTGRHTVYFAKSGFHVYGFDWSRTAVSRTRVELYKERLGAKLKIWDMNDVPLPYTNSFFDGVLVMRVFHHAFIDKIRKIAAEIERVTRKGGYIYVEVPQLVEIRENPKPVRY